MRGWILACGPFDLHDAAGYTGQGIVGATPPTATVGFVHALDRDVRERLPEIRLEAGGVVVHEAALLEGHAKFPPSDAAIAKARHALPGPEVLDDILLRGRVTFLIHVLHEGDAEDARDDVDALRSLLPGLIMARRYAGGSLHPLGRISGLTSAPLTLGQIGNHLRTMPRGFLLRDRRDYLEQQLASGAPDALDVLMDTVAFQRTDDGGIERAVKGALCPISVGYRALEQPRRRRTNRSSSEDRLHVYADNLASVGQWMPLRTLSRSDHPLDGCLWQPFVDEDLGLYYASASGKATSTSLPSKGF